MTLNEIEDRIIGNWTGENLLRLSWMTPSEYMSASLLSAAKAVGGKFLALDYTWEHENAAHEGLLLVGFDVKQEVINAMWADSWHSSVKPLPLAGKINDSDIEMYGSYEVPNHPDWGWKILISLKNDALQLIMYNVTPEGEEDLAVQADYKRV